MDLRGVSYLVSRPYGPAFGVSVMIGVFSEPGDSHCEMTDHDCRYGHVLER